MPTKRKTTSKRTSGEQQIREFFAQDLTPRTLRVNTGEQALTLSPFFAGVRLYCSIISSLPLVTYTRNDDGGRERARDRPEYKILHDRPNPAQTRCVFVEQLIRNLFLFGDAFALIQRDGTGTLTNLFPLCPSAVSEIMVDDQWNKFYFANDRVYDSSEVVHVMMNSRDGVQGTPLLKYAAEALGLSKQVQEAASSYYRNAVRTPIYVKGIGKLTTETRKNLEEFFATKYAGAMNSGKVPVIQDAEIAGMPSTTASDAQLLTALGSSVSDIARWLNLSPIALGDYSAAHYASLSADNVYLYQRSIAPVLAPIEAELNLKLFGDDEATFCEFLVDSILRGDPREQAETTNVYVQNGTLTRNEVRAMLNRENLDTLDVPLKPVNMEAVAVNIINGQPEAETDQGGEPEPLDVNAFLEVVDKVAAKSYPPEAAVAILKVACPQVPEDTIRTIVASLAAKPDPQQQEVTPNADSQPSLSV